jgi:hypothetical protein
MTLTPRNVARWLGGCAALSMAVAAHANCNPVTGEFDPNVIVAGTSQTVVALTACVVNSSLTIDLDARFYVDGQLNNYGVVANAGEMWVHGFGVFNNNNQFSNSGLLHLDPGSSFQTGAGATFNNTGSVLVTWDPPYVPTLVNHGTWNNNMGGTIEFNGGALLDFTGGTFNNNSAATVVFNGSALFLANPSSGTFNFNAGGTAINNTVIVADLLENAGTFQNQGTGYLSATTLNNTGTFVNTGGLALLDAGNGSVLNNRSGATFTIGPESASFTGGNLTINNAGTFNMGVDFSVGPSYEDSNFQGNVGPMLNNMIGGTFVNGAVFTIRADAVLANHGEFINNGTLEIGTELHGNGMFQNFGKLTNHSTINSTWGVLSLEAGSTYDFTGGTLNVGSPGTLVLNRDFALGAPEAGTVNILFASNFVNNATLTIVAGYSQTIEANAVNNGAFINSGLLNQDGGTMVNTAGATFHNSVTGEVSIQNGWTNQGSVVNDGVWQTSNYGTVHNEKSFTNTGLVNLGPLPYEIEYGGIRGAGSYLQTGASAVTVVDGMLEQGSVTIDGGSLQGTGTVRAPLVTFHGGVLAPGPFGDLTIGNALAANARAALRSGQPADGSAHLPGTLTIDGDLNFVDGLLLLEIAGTASGTFDVLHVTGHASFAAGTLKLVFLDGYVPDAGDHWTLMTADGGTSGLNLLQVAYDGLPPGYGFTVTLGADGGLDVGFGAPAAVPEPAAWVLLLAGLAAVSSWKAERRRSARLGVLAQP